MKYRKKPVIIEAIKWTGTNIQEMAEFCNNDGHGMHEHPNGTDLIIYTLEGEHTASLGDYIIKGVKGEFYPCKPDIFEMTYEKVK